MEEICLEYCTDIYQVRCCKIRTLVTWIAIAFPVLPWFTWLPPAPPHPPHLRTLTGSDQRQGCRVPGQGRPQHPHSAPHHAGVGQVLQPAGGRLLPPPVGRFHHVLRRLHHRGCHRGRAAHGRREFKGSVDVNRTEPGLSAPRLHRWVSTRHRNGTRHEFDGRVNIHVWGLLLGAVDRPSPPAPPWYSWVSSVRCWVRGQRWAAAQRLNGDDTEHEWTKHSIRAPGGVMKGRGGWCKQSILVSTSGCKERTWQR